MEGLRPVVLRRSIPESMSHDGNEKLHEAMSGHSSSHIDHHVGHQKFAVAQAGFWEKLLQKLIESEGEEQRENAVKEQRYDRHVYCEPQGFRIYDPVTVHKG